MLSSLLFAALSSAAGSYAWNQKPQHHQSYYVNISYSTVSGYFLQDLASTNAATFDYVGSASHENSSLIDRNHRLPLILA